MNTTDNKITLFPSGTTDGTHWGSTEVIPWSTPVVEPYFKDVTNYPCLIEQYFKTYPKEKSVCLYCSCPKCSPWC